MKRTLLLFLFPGMISFTNTDPGWLHKKQPGYTLSYTSKDKNRLKEYDKFFKKGIVTVKSFFGRSYSKKFEILLHPDRHSLDSTWQQNWNMPGFHSECWMVASGTATRLDIISPALWDMEACDHHYSDTGKTQQLITHELVHVYHGQANRSPDFSAAEGIDWFVEGLATYASGQCDAYRMREVSKAIRQNKVPALLDSLWTGNLRYGLAGSVVMFIDTRYTRAKLITLLAFSKKQEILGSLNSTEAVLLSEWKEFMKKTYPYP